MNRQIYMYPHEATLYLYIYLKIYVDKTAITKYYTKTKLHLCTYKNVHYNIKY